MAVAKVQVTLTYEYSAEYDGDGIVTDEHARISNDAQDLVRDLIGSSVNISKGKTVVVSDVTIKSGGVSVTTIPQNN